MSIATEEQQVVEKVQNKLYIGGEWRDASGGGTLEGIDPATEEAICEVADGTPEDAMAALDAAVDAGAGPDPRGGRAAGRRGEHPHDVLVGLDHRTADRGPAAAEAVVHR